MNFLRFIILTIVLGLPAQVVADVMEVDNPTLQGLQAQGVTIIDIRRPDEWSNTGIIEGSHGITFFDAKGRYDVNAWLAELSELIRPDQPFVLICARGVRSSKLAGLLDKQLGYSAVHNVTDGILEWLKQGKPVVSLNSPK
ncbi:MAG: rhodanese-related sulfurtransferase [bacterium]